jgi:hypothetical protein
MDNIIAPNRWRWVVWNSLKGAAIRDSAGVLNGLLQALDRALEIRP